MAMNEETPSHNQIPVTAKLLASFSCGVWRPAYDNTDDWKSISNNAITNFMMATVNGRGQPIVKEFNVRGSILQTTAQAATINYSATEIYTEMRGSYAHSEFVSNVHGSLDSRESDPTTNTVTIPLNTEHPETITVNGSTREILLKVIAADGSLPLK
jgi:hypothetical protein